MKICLALIFFIFSTFISFSQIQTIDTIPQDGILLNEGWKFHAGDYADWSKPDYNDSDWQLLDPTKDLYYIPEMKRPAIGWLRIKFFIDSNLLNKPLAYQVFQSIASEIYLNGKLLEKYGVVSTDKNKVKAWQPSNQPQGIIFTKREQTLAVRFSVQKNLFYIDYGHPFYAFRFRINEVKKAIEFLEWKHQFPSVSLSAAIFFGTLGILHLILFFKLRRKSYLYFSIATLFIAIVDGLWLTLISGDSSMYYITNCLIFCWAASIYLYYLFLLLAVYNLFTVRKGYYFWFLIVFLIAGMFFYISSRNYGAYIGWLPPFILIMIETLRIAFKAYRKGERNAMIIVAGLLAFFVIFIIFACAYTNLISDTQIGLGEKFILSDALYWLYIISVPVCLALYLSLDFASTSKELQKRLLEVKQLAEEKQEMLITQNETLEKQVEERTSQLEHSLYELKSTQTQLIQSEKMASLGELTAGIAHEIQNPLNFVNNFSDVNTELIVDLQNELNAGNAKEAILIANDINENEQKINHHGKRADAIVKGMLQHSRASTGKKEPTDLNALADEYLRLSYHGFRAKDKDFNAEYKTDFDEGICKIEVVQQDIGRVLLNLYNNAFYAVYEKRKQLSETFKPTVSVSTKRVGNTVELSVKDNGAGIPQNIVEKIFQPFFTTKPTGKGTGLGLSLSYDIIKAHGGELRVESKEGEGAEFFVQLPLV